MNHVAPTRRRMQLSPWTRTLVKYLGILGRFRDMPIIDRCTYFDCFEEEEEEKKDDENRGLRAEEETAMPMSPNVVLLLILGVCSVLSQQQHLYLNTNPCLSSLLTSGPQNKNPQLQKHLPPARKKEKDMQSHAKVRLVFSWSAAGLILCAINSIEFQLTPSRLNFPLPI